MIYPDLYALLRSDPEAVRYFRTPPAHIRDDLENKSSAEPKKLGQGMAGHPFSLGVYPVLDDDVPRDYSFENFPAPDLQNLHPYP